MIQSVSARSLLLNASYEPMRIVTWQKAMILWFLDKVEVLEYHEDKANSAHEEFALPSVMRLKTYIRDAKNQKIKFCRDNLYLRDDYLCQYCGQKFNTRELTMDHVLPASRGGKKNWSNMVTACRKCNQKKGNRTPEEARMPLLNKPRRPDWLPSKKISVRSENMPTMWESYMY